MIGEFESHSERPVTMERPNVERQKEMIQKDRSMQERLAGERVVHERVTHERMAQERDPVPEKIAEKDNQLELDLRSQTMIREVKNEFNLSTDQEALRLLLSVGFKKLKNIE